MAFGDVVRYLASPGGNPSGLGGKANVIWHCDASEDKVYELSTTDLGVVRSANSPGTFPNGIGGTATKIWHCDASSDCKVYELSTSDLGVVRSAEPVYSPESIGGDNSKIWNLSWNEGYTVHSVNELSTTDFSVVRSGTPPATGTRIGGDASIIWLSSISSAKVYELSTTDFSVDRSVDSPTNNPTGIGGDADTLWYLHNLPFPPTEPDRVYELVATSAPPTAPTGLLCNGLTNPVDVIPSYFSAIYHGGYTGKHYQIQVNKQADFAGAMMWNSGKTAMSDVADTTRPDDIYYNGQALSLNKLQYYWRIKFWDSEGDASPWSSAANFTMAGSGAGEAGAGPWEEDMLDPTGEAKVEIPRRSGQWTTLEDVMRIHTNVNKNPLDAIELAQAEVICSNISKNFNSFEEASGWYKNLEGYALSLSLGCKVGVTPISRKLFTGIISKVHVERLSQTAELRVVDFLDYFGRVTIKETPIWENITLTQLYKNLVELAFSEWEEGVDYFVEDLGGSAIPAIGYEDLNLLSELKNIAESRGKRIFTDVNGKLVCRSRAAEGEAWVIKHDYNLEDVKERRDLDNVYNWIVVHARPHEILPDTTPPGKISGFTATPEDQKIDLTWNNPTDDDFQKVLIRFSTTDYPNIEDGTKIYEGTGQSKSHTGLTNGKRYYYSGFTRDTTGNWSGAAHTSAVAGTGGGQWADDTSISRVYGFRATPEHSKIILTWYNPKLANFELVRIRSSATTYPSGPTVGNALYEGTEETTTHSGLTNGRRYYYSAFVKDTADQWSGAAFASAVPAGARKTISSQTVTGGGCLTSQAGVPRDWIAVYGCFYAGTSGFYKKQLSFMCRGRSQNWLRFRHEWDIKATLPYFKVQRRIGLDDDLSLSFSKGLGGLAQVTVSVISVTTIRVQVEYKLVYTGPRGIRWDFRNILSLRG